MKLKEYYFSKKGFYPAALRDDKKTQKTVQKQVKDLLDELDVMKMKLEAAYTEYAEEDGIFYQVEINETKNDKFKELVENAIRIYADDIEEATFRFKQSNFEAVKSYALECISSSKPSDFVNTFWNKKGDVKVLSELDYLFSSEFSKENGRVAA